MKKLINFNEVLIKQLNDLKEIRGWHTSSEAIRALISEAYKKHVSNYQYMKKAMPLEKKKTKAEQKQDKLNAELQKATIVANDLLARIDGEAVVSVEYFISPQGIITKKEWARGYLRDLAHINNETLARKKEQAFPQGKEAEMKIKGMIQSQYAQAKVI